MIPIRTIRLEYMDNLEVEVRPAIPELNPIFAAFAHAVLKPLEIAARLPDDHPRALTEERALAALHRCYAAGVMLGSPTHPEMNDWVPAEWEKWLAGQVDAFLDIKDVCESEATWDESEAD